MTVSITMHYQHYSKDHFFNQFSKTEIYKKLSKKYKYLRSDDRDILEIIPEFDPWFDQPLHRTELEKNSIFLYSTFYYLDFLLETKPDVIADIGCGANLFKDYIPNIIGIDQTINADIKEYFNSKFVSLNLSKFDAAFAINSLHYISLTEFSNRINEFGKIIKPGGRGFMAFNLKRLLENTEPHEYAQLFDLTKKLSAADYKRFIFDAIKNVKYKILVFDVTFNDIYKDELRYENLKGVDWPPSISDYFSLADQLPDHIRKEIDEYEFDSEMLIDKINEGYTGNIRIVFEV